MAVDNRLFKGPKNIIMIIRLINYQNIPIGARDASKLTLARLEIRLTKDYACFLREID